MKHLTLRTLVVSAMLAPGIFAQGNQRQATMVGGGDPNRGKCTLEVVVDGAAQVEVRGNTATLKDISGRPPQWRRFECTSPIPTNPANFRFAGVDGRGRQELVRDPRQGGVAVVQIQDSEGGAQAYTFDLFWDNSAPSREGTPTSSPNYPQDQRNGAYQRNNPQQQQPDYRGQQQPDYRGQQQPNYPDRMQQRSEPPASGYQGGYQDRDYEQYRPDYRSSDYYRRYGHGFGTDEAVRVCQNAVVQQATRRFGSRADVHFHRTTIDDQPGRNDYVVGTLDVHRGGREERFRFSCSVNFDNGRIRSAELDSRPLPDDQRWH